MNHIDHINEIFHQSLKSPVNYFLGPYFVPVYLLINPIVNINYLNTKLRE